MTTDFRISTAWKWRAPRVRLLALAARILVSASTAAHSSQPAAGTLQPLMDRQDGIALALSACPPSVASKAAVPLGAHTGHALTDERSRGSR